MNCKKQCENYNKVVGVTQYKYCDICVRGQTAWMKDYFSPTDVNASASLTNSAQPARSAGRERGDS